MSEQEPNKFCNICKKEVPFSEIYPRYSHCRKCHKEYRNEIQKKYRASIKGKNARRKERQRLKQTGKIKEYLHRYYKTDKAKAARKRNNQKIKQKYPKQFLATKMLGKRVLRGQIPKVSTLFCLMCFKPAEHYHHFINYETKHWYHVFPLCAKCHWRIHLPKLIG